MKTPFQETQSNVRVNLVWVDRYKAQLLETQYHSICLTLQAVHLIIQYLHSSVELCTKCGSFIIRHYVTHEWVLVKTCIIALRRSTFLKEKTNPPRFQI